MSRGREVYPPGALADDEPRYIRRQKPLEIRRRQFGSKSWPAYRRWTLMGAAILAAGFLSYHSIRFLLFSPTVEFAGFDQLQNPASQIVGRTALTGVFSPDIGEIIVRGPRGARRTEL